MKTHVTFVIDRSGSMGSIANEMSAGFNMLIEEQKKNPDTCSVSLFEFNSTVTRRMFFAPLSAVESYQIRPGGNTAMCDAICIAIDDTGQHLAMLPESERPSKVLVVVITDGYENWSTRFWYEDVRSRVKHQQEKYSWEFLFLGADQDAVLNAKSYGMSHTAATYESRDTKRVIGTVLCNTVTATRGGASLDMNSIQNQIGSA